MSKTINCLVDHKGAPCACDMSIYENLNKPIKTPTQNDEIGKMEKAINEGFAESERDLKDKKTPLDQPTQNDWAEDLNYFDFKSIEDRDKCLAWIETLLADARREVIEKVEKELEGLDCGFCNYEKEVKERLATLREEGK